MGKGTQVLSAVAASFCSFLMGMLNAWPSYTLKEYTSNTTTLLAEPMTSVEGSLLGSLPSLGAMLGTAFVGPLLDKVGRQKGGVLMNLPLVLAWAVIGQSSSVMTILAARFLMGTTGGAGLVYGPLFISEVAEDSIRGALASGPVGFYCIGSLVSYLCGWFLSYQYVIWANLACGVLAVVLCFMVVESPIYLLRQKREEDARIALSKYRSVAPESKVVSEEIHRLKAMISPAVEMVDITDNGEETPNEAEKEKLNPDAEKNGAEVTPAAVKKPSTFALLFKAPTSRRAFITVACPLTMQVFMGMVPIMVYAKDLFAAAAPDLSPDFCSVLLAITMVLGVGSTTVIADRAGRKVLLISSSIMVAVCMGVLGFLLQTKVGPAVVTPIFILLFCFFFNFGAGSMPYVLLAEVFTPEVQGLASMILVEWAFFLNFVLIAVFPVFISLLGIHGSFYVFGVVAVANVAYSFLKVPETKGLSNEEIQDIFRNRR